jgi:uncharacterized 2Fe-2S/4Fe-4S cluster protein (DUF4445 family)
MLRVDEKLDFLNHSKCLLHYSGKARDNRMPIITFAPSGKTVEVPQGTTLYDAALGAGFPVASSCSAEGVCGKCNLRVVRGGESLSAQSELEKRLLKKEHQPETDRISCQTQIFGDCTVTASYW